MRKQDRVKTIGKRYQALAKQTDPEKLLDPMPALELTKSLATAKFDETVTVAINASASGSAARPRRLR